MTDRPTDHPDRESEPATGTVRVVLRPLGTSMPLGLFGLAAASLVSSGLELGWIPLGSDRS